MLTKQTKIDPQRLLIKELKSLSKEVRHLKDLEFVRILKHPMKFMWFSFLKGLMIGFGSVLGASILVALFLYMMKQIQFVPIVGNFVTSVIEEVDPEGSVREGLGTEKINTKINKTKDVINTTTEKNLEPKKTPNSDKNIDIKPETE